MARRLPIGVRHRISALRRRLASPPVQEALPAELTDRGSRRDIELPEGWSLTEVFDLLSTLSIEKAPPAEIEGYLREDFERFLITWSLVRECTGKALEIGANPYFTTVLLREFTDLELSLTNSFDSVSTAVASQHVAYRDPRPAGTIEVDELIEYRSLNVETAGFPWPDGYFDVVVFCEVIEHLLSDPLRALIEIHRVLKPGGTVLVSTPNVARLENVARMVAGVNLYDPYSGYGPYGRHNREFTRHELVQLLEFAGFSAGVHFTADVHAHHTASFVDPVRLAPLVVGRLPDLGQYIFCRATKTGAPRAGRPSELYRSLPADSLVSWSAPAS